MAVHNNQRLGTNDIYALFKRENPDYIGINIFAQNFDIVKEIVEHCPVSAIIIIGGQVVKSVYAEVLTWNVENDLILIIGEGELLLLSILNGVCVEQPILTVGGKSVYRVDINLHYFPHDLNAVRLDRTLLKGDTICNHYNQREASIITFRGCRYNCAFCGGAHNLNRDISIRYRDILDVEHEILEILNACPDVTSIRVLDDLFLRDDTSISNAIELFDRHHDITWRGMAHILTFAESFEMLPQLKMSGCRELFVGIDSGSETMRRKINKPGNSDKVISVVTALLQVGIDVKGYFMYDFPSETIHDADATFALAAELNQIGHSTEGDFRLRTCIHNSKQPSRRQF